MNKITLKWLDIKKLVRDKIDSSFDETLRIDEIDIVGDDELKKRMGTLCLQEESKCEDTENSHRLAWGGCFLAIGILLGIIFIFRVWPFLPGFLETKSYLTQLLWSSSWTAIGISLGLYNSRNESSKRSKENRHYYTYFLFVFIIITLVSFVLLGTFDKNVDRVYVYVAASLTGIILGFSGDKLGDKLNIIK